MPATSRATRDPRVDDYLLRARPFAQPILKELRARLHAAVPGLSETIKWHVPFFLLGERIFASMAAFKAHTKLILWSADFKMAHTMDFAALDELPKKSALAAQLTASAKSFAGAPPKARVKPSKTRPVRKKK